MKNILLVAICLIVGSALTVSAQTKDVENAFRKVIEIPKVDVVVPTVVSLPLTDQIYTGADFLVREVETDTYVGSLFSTVSDELDLRDTVEAYPSTPGIENVIDSFSNSFVDFPIYDENTNSVTLVVRLRQPITTSRLNLKLAEHVALPTTIEIKAGSGDMAREIVVARKRMDSETVTFLETVADTFEITLEYVQPLRISEVDFDFTYPARKSNQSLRFLAQPNYSYEVFFDGDRRVNVRLTESGNLHLNEDVFVLPAYVAKSNRAYIPSDIDEDGIKDVLDNCVNVINSDQVDINNNGRGDVCDDFDKDGVTNIQDNCPNQPNGSQADEDYDDVGDACDTEESRFTERNKWIPWVGIGTAMMVIFVLFLLVAKGPKPDGFVNEEKVE